MINVNFLRLTIILALAVFPGVAVLAQTEPEPSPLESSTPDPLLPQTAVDRPLSTLERSRIELATQELNERATEALAGNEAEAFALWYRELRLQRALGKLAEVQALGRVGEIAWESDRLDDVQIITDRLEAIEAASETLDLPLLKAFGQAYEQVHAPKQALNIYQQILARADQETIDPEATLKKIGQLQLSLFLYPQAAATYEQLLEEARSQSDSFNEGLYLHQLAQIYSQALQPENALRIKQQLAQRYLQRQQIQQLPELKIAIASDYDALNQPEKASQNYQEAFSLAWSLQQFATAGDALEQLGDLYRRHNQESYALQVYQELLKLEQQTYDFYGLMNTYDRIGQIYVSQNDYDQALAAYREALQLARSLNYQEDYFLAQIEQVNQMTQ